MKTEIVAESEVETDIAAPVEPVRGKRILLVEDERIMREAVRRVLALDKHVVVEANNGAEAFSIFTQSQFDLVISDCVMPFVSGDELAKRIKRFAPDQPILMLTGHKVKRGPGNPVDAVLDKPCDVERLREEIARLL